MKVGVKASGLWWERGWDFRPGWAPLRKGPSRGWAKTSWAPLNLCWGLKQNPSGCSQRGWQVRGWIWFGQRSQPWWGFSPLLGWSARRPLPSWQSASVHLASQTPASQNQLWPKVGNNNEPSFIEPVLAPQSGFLSTTYGTLPYFTIHGSSLLRVPSTSGLSHSNQLQSHPKGLWVANLNYLYFL